MSRPEALLLEELESTGRSNLFVADTGSRVVRRIDLSTGRAEVVAGSLTAQNAPGSGLEPATGVRLGRPVALALDSPQQKLYIADSEAGQILEVDLRMAALRVLLERPEVERPTELAYHRFPGGSVLFVADSGGTNVPLGGAGAPRPALFSIDLGLAIPHRDEIQLTFGPGGSYTSLRSIADMTLKSLSDGSASLFLAADVGEQFETYAFGEPTPATLGFEFDCFDGVSDDNDVPVDLVDFEDEDCRKPLQAQILRLDFDASGSDQFAPRVSLVASGFRRFPVEEVSFDDDDDGDGCPGDPAVTATPPLDFPMLVPTALALGPNGTLFVVDSLAQVVSQITLPPAPRQLVPLFGTSFELASPFDGSSPRTTKLNLPRAIAVDSLANLYVADTVHNRIRRAWVGDLIGQ
jgi:hypothetical protein